MLRRVALLIPALALSGSWLACFEPPARQELPDWSAGREGADAGVVGSDAGVEADAAEPDAAVVVTEAFALRAATDVDYDTRIRETGAGNAPCEVMPDGTPQGYERKECTLDINELDLYGNGLDFDFSVPAGACEYVIYGHYMYEAFEVGVGPTEVSWEVDAVGNVSNPVNAVNGQPFCEFDHRWEHPDAPNCCTGSYSLTITNTATGQVAVAGPLFWGGRVADCYNGAAFWDPEASFSEDGWPMDTIVFTRELAWEKRFHWPLLSTDYYTNLVLASYYDPADHLPGGAPAGLLAPFARPHSVFLCFDHAEELLAELRLVVKEWNEEREFYADLDPDTEGTEPLSGTPINDRRDWADATPGSEDFVGLFQ